MKNYQIKTITKDQKNPLFVIVDNREKPIKVYSNATDAMYKVQELNDSLSISLHELLTDVPFNILESVN